MGGSAGVAGNSEVYPHLLHLGSKSGIMVIAHLDLATRFDWWSVGIVVGEIPRWVGDCYILTNKRACKWGSCAPQIILQEAWGKITDVFWNNINYLDWTEKLPNLLVVTNGKIHEKIIEKTKEIFKDSSLFYILE